MAHVAEQQAAISLVENQPNVTAYTDRPEILISGLVKTMKMHPRIGGVQLQIKSRRLDRLLLVAGEFG